YLLAAPSTPPEARDEIIQRAEAGEQVTVAEVKTAIAKRRPEPKPKRKYAVNPAAAALFANEDQLHAFAGVVNLKTVRKFVTHDQQVNLAKELIENNVRAAAYQSWVSDWLRQAGKLQGRIDALERDDLYKEIPGYEIRDEVAAVKSATRPFVASLLKLEDLWKKFPHNPFFGDIGSTLDDVINMIRQYRRASGEKSADEIERKLARLRELEDKARRHESTIEGLRSEIEEAKATTRSARDDVGPDSAAEAARLRVYVEKLEAEKRCLEMKLAGLEREVADAKAAAKSPPKSKSGFRCSICHEKKCAPLRPVFICDGCVHIYDVREAAPTDDGDPGPIPDSLDRTKRLVGGITP